MIKKANEERRRRRAFFKQTAFTPFASSENLGIYDILHLNKQQGILSRKGLGSEL